MKIIFFIFIFIFVTGCVVKPPSFVSGFCSSDSDCIPDSCCHATGCISKDQAPNCNNIACTLECAPGTLDCGGYCSCEKNKCTAILEFN